MGRSTQYNGGGVTLGKAVLGAISKQAEQAMTSEPASSVPL